VRHLEESLFLHRYEGLVKKEKKGSDLVAFKISLRE
jgi:hypothetical protein